MFSCAYSLDWFWASYAVLQALRAATGEAALGICRQLNSSFIDHGKMHCAFARILKGMIAVTPKEMQDSTAITTFDITYEDRSYKVPIFTRWFKREPVACRGCHLAYRDIAYGSAEDWIESCGGFASGWQWEILHFPAFLSLKCTRGKDGDDNAFTTECSRLLCNGCCAAHIKCQVNQFGPLYCDYLHCPACPRPLDYYEVRLLTNRETFDK